MPPIGFAVRCAAILAFVIFISYPLVMLQAAPSGVTTGKEILAKVSKKITDISTEELKALLEKDPGVYLIDVRTVRETILLGGTIRAKRNTIIPRGWLVPPYWHL